MRHEYSTYEQVTQIMCDVFKIRRVQQIPRGDVMHPRGANATIHVDQCLVFVLESTVRSDMHQTDFDGAIAFLGAQSSGLKVHNSISLTHPITLRPFDLSFLCFQEYIVPMNGKAGIP